MLVRLKSGAAGLEIISKNLVARLIPTSKNNSRWIKFFAWSRLAPECDESNQHEPEIRCEDVWEFSYQRFLIPIPKLWILFFQPWLASSRPLTVGAQGGT